MAKLVKFWYDRNTLTRAGIVWVVVFQLVHVVFWYVSQNIGVSTMSTANTLNIVSLTFWYLEAAAGVLVLLGIVSDLGKKRTRKEDPMKMADGRYMIKK